MLQVPSFRGPQPRQMTSNIFGHASSGQLSFLTSSLCVVLVRRVGSHIAPLAIMLCLRLSLAWNLNQASSLVLLNDRGVR